MISRSDVSVPGGVGGANGFEIQVDSQANVNIGSDVDAAVTT